MKMFKFFNLPILLLVTIILPFNNLIEAGYLCSRFKKLTKFGSENYIYIAGSFLCLTTTLAILEMYQKNVKQKEILKVLAENNNLTKQLSKVINDGKILERELNSYKNDIEQLALYEKLISSATVYAKSLEESYAEEISLFNVPEFQDSEINFSYSLENICSVIIDKIKRKYGSFFNYQEILNSELIGLHTIQEQLILKKLDWKNNDKLAHLIKESDIVIEKISCLTNNFKLLATFCERQKYFIEVIPMLQKDFENIYATEISVVQNSFLSDLSNFDTLIDKHILALYSSEQYQFPYLSYAEKIKEDKSILEKAISNLSKLNLAEFQIQFLKRAQEIKQILDIVFEHVVTSNKYKEEKSYKPEFDRKEAQLKAQLMEKEVRLQMELKEKEAKIELDKSLAQARYLTEKNKNQELENEKAKIEKNKNEIMLNNNQILLNIAKQNVKQALDQNDKKWNHEFDQLDAKYKKTKDELESIRRDYNWALRKYEDVKVNADLYKRELDQFKAKHSNIDSDLDQAKREIAKLKHEISDLNSKMKAATYHNDNSSKEIQRLKSAISNTVHYIDEINTALANPPFNPEMVDGLKSYLERLKERITIIQSTLSR